MLTKGADEAISILRAVICLLLIISYAVLDTGFGFQLHSLIYCSRPDCTVQPHRMKMTSNGATWKIKYFRYIRYIAGTTIVFYSIKDSGARMNFTSPIIAAFF